MKVGVVRRFDQSVGVGDSPDGEIAKREFDCWAGLERHIDAKPVDVDARDTPLVVGVVALLFDD